MIYKLLNFLFPKECISCWKKGEYLCKECKKKLITQPEMCPHCQKVSKDYSSCLNCTNQSTLWLNWLIVGFKYNNIIKKIVLNFKYYHKFDLWDFISDRLILMILSNKVLSKKIKENNLIISFVPNHWIRKYFIKWYNQSEILWQIIAKKLWIKLIKICNKIKYTKPQTKLNRQQRLKNLLNSFDTKSHLDLEWKTILIVDDITTTGSTLQELAKSIKKQYSKTNVRWIVLWKN